MKTKNDIGLIFFLSIWGGLIVISLSPPIQKDENKECKKTNLFMGYSSDNFNIKTTLIEGNNGDTTTTRKVVKNVQWAQLKLYPTIGCTHPTLFYLADNSQQVQKIEVNDATIIK
jgi:hypothetical protein